MKMYVSKPNMFYKFIPRTGKTDYDTLRFTFTFLQKGDFMLDGDGNIYEVLDPGQLDRGFSNDSRDIEVKKVAFDELPKKVQDAIYYLAQDYPPSEICRKVLEVVQQG